MSEYENRRKLEAASEKPQFEVQVFSDDTRGYFEHNEVGDDCAGELWFERNAEGKMEITDYDGVVCLPKEVIETLRKAGFVIGEEFE